MCEVRTWLLPALVLVLLPGFVDVIAGRAFAQSQVKSRNVLLDERPSKGGDQRPEPDISRPPAPQPRPDRRSSGRIYKATIQPHWFANNTRFWYRNDLPRGCREYILVDAANGIRHPAFDHQRLAESLHGVGLTDCRPERLPIEGLVFDDACLTVSFRIADASWKCDLKTYQLQPLDTSVAPESGGLSPLDPRNVPRSSTRTGPETELRFANRTDSVVELFWLDSGGVRRSYGRITAGQERAQHTFAGHVWIVVDQTGTTLAVFEAPETPAQATISGKFADYERRGSRPSRNRSHRPRNVSPGNQWTALIQDDNVYIRSHEDGELVVLSRDGHAEEPYALLDWSPDGTRLVAARVEPSAIGEVYLIESSPSGGGRARLLARPYALPGDKFASYELNIFEVATRRQIKPPIDRIDFGRPRLRWDRDGRHFTYEQTDRGHQRFRLIQVDCHTGESRLLVDETSNTFIWTAHVESLQLLRVTWLTETDEIIYASERDGWYHLYLLSAESGQITNLITPGPYVVRAIDYIDESRRQVWFRACGLNGGQDPYLMHYYRINFDGTGLVALTAGNGYHSIQYSPDRAYLIDTYSRVDMAPVHELRRVADGTLVCPLERADESELVAAGWQPPEVFVAKGRDGQTDIWGIICRPARLDPERKYPILEDIYAGPQSAYVPKTFSAANRYASLTELGFVVVKIDGMGTAHRSKQFHDVCWHNLKDAGLPDRILWIQAAAKKYQYLDTSRVGIYGTSAGGQNAAAAVLFHPEFYKAAVATCGCHDNRLDKASWNEQWMGYPVGPQYAECSNIENAHRLQGKLMLIVGELDTNVPPESTIRFADSLIKAGKDFDLVLIPGAGHGDGGAYGRRRMRDFFVRHLLD